MRGSCPFTSTDSALPVRAMVWRCCQTQQRPMAGLLKFRMLQDVADPKPNRAVAPEGSKSGPAGLPGVVTQDLAELGQL